MEKRKSCRSWDLLYSEDQNLPHNKACLPENTERSQMEVAHIEILAAMPASAYPPPAKMEVKSFFGTAGKETSTFQSKLGETIDNGEQLGM